LKNYNTRFLKLFINTRALFRVMERPWLFEKSEVPKARAKNGEI